MRLLVDMNLSPRWVDLLAAAGIEAAHWSSLGAANAPDPLIMAYARAHDFVVLTHDLDFGTALALTGASRPSVFQIRGRRVLPEQVGALVLTVLERYRSELELGALVVVDEQKTRVRILPLS